MNKDQSLLLIILLIPLSRCQLKDTETKNLADYSNHQSKFFNWIIYEIYDYLMYFGIVIVVTVVIYLVIKFIRHNREQYQPQPQPIPQTTSPLIQNGYIQNQPYYLPINAPYCCLCNQLITVQTAMNQVITSQIIMQCGHSFHYECIINYLKTQNTCPTCNFVLQPETQIQQPLYIPEDTQGQLDINQHENYMAPGNSIQDLK